MSKSGETAEKEYGPVMAGRVPVKEKAPRKALSYFTHCSCDGT